MMRRPRLAQVAGDVSILAHSTILASMSDPSNKSSSSNSSTPASSAPAALPAATPSSAELHAQAVRFLTSVRARGAASEEEQRTFLRSKGLSEAAIAAALADAERPAAAGVSGLALPSPEHAGEDDSQAWERAARAFNDPIHADPASVRAPALPGKSYPRSPLALYHDAAAARQAQQGGVEEKLTRYQVLLRFFRTFSYMLVLGGGISAVAVALYRVCLFSCKFALPSSLQLMTEHCLSRPQAYLLPRLTKTLDARSQLLKHHHELYTMLLTRLRTLGANSLSPCAVPATPSAADEAVTAGLSGEEIKKRGVLKRVQFADEKEGGSLELAAAAAASEEKKAEDSAASSEKDAIKGALKKDAAVEGDADAETTQGEEATAEPKVEPIFLFNDLTTSLASLTAALRADVSARAIGTPPTAAAAARVSSSTSPHNTFSLLPPKSLAATVHDASEGSGTDSWEDTEADSDGLEFDPFAPVPSGKRTGSGRRRKHSPAPASAAPAHKDATAELMSKLGSLNSFVHAQSFLSAATPNRWATIGAGGAGTTHTAAQYMAAAARHAGAGSGNASASGGETSGGEGTAKPADVAQIKAEIRSLKGLLLSR